MLNRGRFGHVKFDQKIVMIIKHRSATFQEDVKASVGFARISHRTTTFHDTVKVSARVVMVRPRTMYFAENGMASASLVIAKTRTPKFEENIKADANLSKIVSKTMKFAESVNAQARLNKIFSRVVSFAEDVDAAVLLGRRLSRESTFTEEVNAFVDVISIKTTIDTINIEIPPGARLVLNSEDYTVTLNNMNIYKWHAGAFITIDRKTLEMVVTGGTAADIGGFLSYVEKYI